MLYTNSEKSRHEIEDHERWYARYVELREKQREELREWKLLRKTQVTRTLPSTNQQITFVHQWLKHRPQVRQKLNQWKVLLNSIHEFP